MNKAEIAAQCQWDYYDMGHLRLHVPLFGVELPFTLFPVDGAGPELTDKMAATIADVLALDPAQLDRVKAMMWEEANFAFQVADYGVESRPGETSLEAHLREFGIAGPEDAFARSVLEEVQIHDQFDSRFAELKLVTGAHNLVAVVVKDGRIIDWGDDGLYLGEFEEDEQILSKRRKAVLG